MLFSLHEKDTNYFHLTILASILKLTMHGHLFLMLGKQCQNSLLLCFFACVFLSKLYDCHIGLWRTAFSSFLCSLSLLYAFISEPLTISFDNVLTTYKFHWSMSLFCSLLSLPMIFVIDLDVFAVSSLKAISKARIFSLCLTTCRCSLSLYASRSWCL